MSDQSSARKSQLNGLGIKRILASLAVWALCAPAAFAHDHTVFDIGVYAEPNLLNDTDSSRFRHVVDEGIEAEFWVGEGVEDEYERDFYRIDIHMSDGQVVEGWVAPEFGSAAKAQEIAGIYGKVLGQMPKILRTEVHTMLFFTGGSIWTANEDGYVHINHGSFREEYENKEESMLHEGVHAALDEHHAEAREWIAAQRADGTYISDYAASAPLAEDLSETFPLYYGITMRPDRFSRQMKDKIEAAIPNRLAYLRKHFPPRALAL